MKGYSISLCVTETVTKGAESETSSGVTDGKRGLPGWDKDSEHEMSKGYKQAQRHWTHNHARACQLYESLPVLLYHRRKRSAYFVRVESVLLTLQKKIIPVYEPLAQASLVEVMLLREHNSRCCKTCSCLSPGKVGRHGKGKSNLRKQTWFSFNNTHSFFWYQELLTTYLPFQEGAVFTGFWNNISEQDSDEILGHGASIVEKSTPRWLLAQGHTVGGEPGQLTFHTGVLRICQCCEDNAIPIHAYLP